MWLKSFDVATHCMNDNGIRVHTDARLATGSDSRSCRWLWLRTYHSSCWSVKRALADTQFSRSVSQFLAGLEPPERIPYRNLLRRRV